MPNSCLLALLLSSCLLPAALSAAGAAQSSNPVPQTPEPTPESSEVLEGSARVLHAQILELFESGQYGQIDAIAQQLRTQHVRFRGGAWQLNVLYGAINTPGTLTGTDAS